MAGNRDKDRENRTVSPNHAFVVGRFGIIFIFTVLLACCITFCLVRTTVVHVKNWNAMGESTLADSVLIEPQRGEILASDGSILATNLYYVDIMMDLRTPRFKIVEFVDSLDMITDSLAKYFPAYDKKGWRKKFDTQLAKAKSERTRNFIIAKAVPEEMHARIKKWPWFRKFSRNYTGLKADPVMKRSYPFGSMARLSIGRVGVTAEDPELHGRSGLECALDSLLYGIPGVKRRAVTNRGTGYVVTRETRDGYDVTTTIDITMQEKGFAKPITREYSIGHSFPYLGRKPIRDTHSPATLPVSRFIEYSSNIGMVKMSLPYYNDEPSRFHRDLEELGFLASGIRLFHHDSAALHLRFLQCRGQRRQIRAAEARERTQESGRPGLHP